MENELQKLVLLAESISISEESKLNPIFLTVDVKLCDSALNRNREGCTERFIQDVVERSADHLCLPFYADVDALLAGDYEKLSHLYDRATRTFGTSMIGSLSEFSYEKDENGITSLYGKIKIPKRDRDIVYRVVDLYELGRFAVSVELSYNPRELVLVDGGKLIDASENSSLTGLCLVWNPACSSAYATDLVAENHADTSDEIVAESEELISERGESNSMKDELEMTAEEQTVETVETVAEEQEAETEVKVEEQTAIAEDTEKKDPEENADKEQDDEDEEEETVAETAEANAEVLSTSVDTHEAVENWGGEPVHVIEYHERIVETLDDASQIIAEQEKQIAELKEIESKYNEMMAEVQAKELADKQEKAKAFAEKQGLDISEVAVAEAIEALDYTKIAELTMAQVKDEVKTEEPAVQKIALASFVEMDVSNDTYGGLLNRRKN